MHAEGERTPPRSRWTSFLALGRKKSRGSCTSKATQPIGHARRARPPHDLRTSQRRGRRGWTVFAVGRATRRWVVAQARRQLKAAEVATEEAAAPLCGIPGQVLAPPSL